MRWKIFYDEGSFGHLDGSPFDAPARGVQVVVQEDPDVGRRLMAQRDFYWWTPDGWFGGDLAGLFDYLAEPGMKRVLFGRYVAYRKYDAAVKAALADPDFPPKSARLETETF